MKFINFLILTAATCAGVLFLQTPAFAQTWMASTNAPIAAWSAVASSADGTKVVAAVYGGGIYTSTNSGLTWTSNSVPARQWWSLASSADGAKLVAAINVLSTVGNGGIYVSTNSGATWVQTPAPSNLQSWDSVSCSTNGTKLVAAGAYGVTYQIYTSTNSGTTWTLITNVPNLNWYSVASSADGTKLVALAWRASAVYTSADSGATWVSNAIPYDYWYSVASSADGTKLVAAAQGDGIDTSTNSGVSWASNNVPNQQWYSVASSQDGSKLVAVAYGAIYTSMDYGQTWASNNVPFKYWTSAASSADGSRLVAVSAVSGGQIYTGQSPPLLSLTSSGTNLVLSWPSTVTGFQLQQNSVLGTSVWSNVVNSVLTTNGQNQVIVSPTNGQAFYRLNSQ